MPLNLFQMKERTVVDRISEWGEDGKERPLNPILRGIIVKVEGDAQMESVQGLYVCFGPEDSKYVQELKKNHKTVEVTVNETTVPAFKIKAAELNEVFDADSRPAKDAWTRLFHIPTNVGLGFENRNAKGAKRRKTVDPLVLTPRGDDGPVKDEIKMALPEKEA